MPTNDSSVITIRVKNALAERVRATAAYSGRTPNKFLNDILGAMFGADDDGKRA